MRNLRSILKVKLNELTWILEEFLSLAVMAILVITTMLLVVL